MKKLILGAAAAAFAAPAFAADPMIYVDEPMAVVAQPDRFSGHIEGYVGGLRFDTDFVDQDAWLFGGAARANYRLTDRFNAQVDLSGESTRYEDGPNFDTLGAGLHLYWRDSDRFAVGVFGSATSVYSLFDLKEYLVGPEAQVYFGNLTLYGQAYMGKLESESGFFPVLLNADIWGARGIVRYFLHDNFKLEGEVAYREYDVDGFENDNWTFAAQADYRFDSTPFSVFGRYQFDRFTNDSGSGELDAHKFLVGLRGTFGAETLKAEDRYGATMDLPQNNLPFFGGGMAP